MDEEVGPVVDDVIEWFGRETLAASCGLPGVVLVEEALGDRCPRRR